MPRRSNSLADLVRTLPARQVIHFWLGSIAALHAKRNELGLEWAKDMLRSNASQPLSAIADRLLADAWAHGSQVDDQTVLLIRRHAEG